MTYSLLTRLSSTFSGECTSRKPCGAATEQIFAIVLIAFWLPECSSLTSIFSTPFESTSESSSFSYVDVLKFRSLSKE